MTRGDVWEKVVEELREGAEPEHQGDLEFSALSATLKVPGAPKGKKFAFKLAKGANNQEVQEEQTRILIDQLARQIQQAASARSQSPKL
eukprot:CAMPEP_0184327362 /NCGR_PEP_ID=MMETSP1049-20130417/143055_1 /TAXON_ID=77928 /ORGANISM="Proteomonas sulcata, Strain CCMP704" /LENGTH=88 /DNA_ID=CAMNT_0026649617 /DNA_START=145 /DNA_END=411 /DNA_ORIENTATION=-